MRLAALLLLVGCGPDWEPTPAAGFRRVAAAHLQQCIWSSGCFEDRVLACFEESRQRCLDAGYPKECGYGEIEGSCK